MQAFKKKHEGIFGFGQDDEEKCTYQDDSWKEGYVNVEIKVTNSGAKIIADPETLCEKTKKINKLLKSHSMQETNYELEI